MNKLFIFYSIFVLIINNFILLPILLISKLFTDKIVGIYNNIIYVTGTAIFKYCNNVSIYICKKNINYLHDMFNVDGSSITIFNHLTQFDYIFFGALLSFSKIITNFNIRIPAYYYTNYFIPGLGLLGYLNNSIIISHNKNKNLSDLEKCKINKNDFMYLFPEGNVYCTKTKNIVDKYCEDNNIEKMKNCLYPRSGALNILHKNNNINKLYSVCIQYDSIKPTGKYHTLLNTKLPNKVYFKVNKHNINKSDNIHAKSVEIFREFDKDIEIGIDESEYILANKYYNEIMCMIFQSSLFITSMLLIYNYSIVRYYYASVIPLYYMYSYIDINKTI